MSAGPEDWGAQPVADDGGPESWGAKPAPDEPQRQGGIVQTVPQAIGMLGSSEGRGQLLSGVAAFPAHFIDGMVDFFKTPGRAVKEGVTPEDETSFALNAALMTIGGRGNIPRSVSEAAAPVAKAFEDQVTKPAAANLATTTVKLDPPAPDVQPAPIRPIEGSPFAGVPRSVAAKTGIPEVDRVLFSPVTQAVIDNAVIDRSHDVPYMAGGSEPLSDPTVYIDKHVPTEQTVKGITFDPAEPWTVHENVEQHTMEMLIKHGMTDEEAYRVAHFEFAEKAEGAWYRAHGIDQVAAEKEQASWLPRIQHEPVDNPPPNLYDKPYPHADVKDAQHESVEESPPSPEEVARAYDIIRNARELDPHDPMRMVAQARELGVVGPQKPQLSDGTPAMAAARATGGDTLKGPEPGGADPWQQRFNQFVGKLDAPGQVQQLIRDAARDNGDFLPARNGDISLAHVEAIANAAGVAPSEINPRGLGRRLKNDAEVRTAMQMMLQVTDAVRDAARDVKAGGGPDSLIKLQEAVMRRVLAVEQVVGLRAEWGRTGNVFQEFLRDVKDQEGLTAFLKDKGRSPGDLRDIADGIDALDREGAARFLTDARTPNFWDKFLFYWTNSLISGPITHAGYVVANAAFAGYEAGVVTPIAGAIGAARRAAGLGAGDRVMMGETAARMWGLLAGTPDALRASFTAARHNIQTPLPGEVAKNINPVINQKPNPIGGAAGAIIGIPSRGAAGIHSFFNFLGYRAELEAQAYREAAKAGAPSGDSFWQKYRSAVANPSDDMMTAATAEGYKLTFITELGENAKKVQALANMRVAGTQPFKLIFPFLHIPINLLKRSYEQTPLALLDSDMRGAILGKEGGAAQDMAVARIMGGSLIGAYAVHLAVNDLITGDGPSEPAERQRWLLTHQPNSVRIGNTWVSYARFGPIGDLLGISANLAEVGPHVADGEYAKAAAHVVKGASRLVLDEVGMQGLVNVIEAASDPDRKGVRFLSNFAGTMIPFSSANRQIASYQDPYMRDAKTFVDQLKQFIPGERQTVAAKRDFLGDPIPNTGHGTVLRTGPAMSDNLRAEMQQLEITPAPPRPVIGGVKLSADLYDKYQATAGPYAKALLEGMVNSPGWFQQPAFMREQAIRAAIKAAHEQAAAAMQMAHPELIQQGQQQRADYIDGLTHSPRKALTAP